MDRRRGPSLRLRLTLSYAGFLLLAGALLMTLLWLLLARSFPDRAPGPPGLPTRRPGLLAVGGPAAATAVAFLLFFGLLGGWVLAGRMLAPLTRITESARRASDGSLSHRIRMDGPEDEFRELADVLDTMLERLESQVTEQQRFAANASHELRTPLAISQTLLDVARKDPTWDRDELIERLHVVNTRAIDLTETLLLLSRSDRRSFTREPVDLSLVAEQAAETLLPLAERRGIKLDVAGEAARVTGSAELVLRMVTNLVQNATVHNLPAGGTVTVHTGPDGDASVVRVENTGPPLPPELVPTLTEPFHRGTKRTRTGEHAGVGLGLAIVASIVRAHDGTLELAARPEGGLVATVRLPA
ncbi:sensor histidine kinase [Amycolatopsis thermoflava]|uniref:sensor histidine kinase n=1 Tax=Amycolatopsis thermoflava TaxID=84480 RepID=UPI003D722130